MKFAVVTLFPGLVKAWAETGLIGQAMTKNLLQIRLFNPRDFATDVHKGVDDSAFGGSDGMVAKFEPWSKAILAAEANRIVFLTPQGKPWNQSMAKEWSAGPPRQTVLVCGRYAGFDHRLIAHHQGEEISVGDYVLNGGEVAAMAVMESLARLVPGVLGNDRSKEVESFSGGLLEAPVFTRPREIEGLPVPAPLLSGNHAEIAKFERDLSLARTQQMRPELIARAGLRSDCKAALERVAKLTAAELSALGLTKEHLERMLKELE